MPRVTVDDGVGLHYEEAGTGIPIVFVHEFAGDCRSYEAQLRHFSRRYRCVAYNARGYPPSDVPEPERYSQARAVDDIRGVMDGLGIDRAHVVGISMGGFATLHFGMTYPDRARSLVVAGCGYGAEPAARPQFAAEAEASASRFETEGMRRCAEAYALGPTRVQLQNKDARGWREFADQLAEHSEAGSARTMRGVQARRPGLYDLRDEMAAIATPMLVMTGDEDWPCLEPALLMKRIISSADLVVMPGTGHALNLEEPDAFNAHLDRFFSSVDMGAWRARDPRAMAGSILGGR